MSGEVRLSCICGIGVVGDAKPAKARDKFINTFWEHHKGQGHGPKPGTLARPLFKGRKLRIRRPA